MVRPIIAHKGRSIDGAKSSSIIFQEKNRSKGYWSLIQRNGGVLKTNKGGQEYEISAGTHISQFSTVLVHCEAYSVLWSGGTL